MEGRVTQQFMRSVTVFQGEQGLPGSPGPDGPPGPMVSDIPHGEGRGWGEFAARNPWDEDSDPSASSHRVPQDFPASKEILVPKAKR